MKNTLQTFKAILYVLILITLTQSTKAMQFKNTHFSPQLGSNLCIEIDAGVRDVLLWHVKAQNRNSVSCETLNNEDFALITQLSWG